MLAFVAAERREFAGVLAHAERVVRPDWPIQFARLVWLNGKAAALVANGPGPKLAGEAADMVRGHEDLTGLVSTGFCGALNPALKLCDIFVATEVLGSGRALAPANAGSSYQTGTLLSIDRVASTAAEKAELRKTGADAVEMEAAAIAPRAREWNLPFYCVRVVTDTSDESFPLDFNQMRDADGRFDRAMILRTLIRKPAALPPLMGLNRRTNRAAKALGDFVARCQF